MTVVDLNVDAGEGYDDDALLGVATSASLACGGHAGDAASLGPVVELCAQRAVVVGAQVSYVDRDGFGRRPLEVDPVVLRDQLLWQAGALQALCNAHAIQVAYLKPHGALYHATLDDGPHAEVVRDVCRRLGLPLLLMAGGDVREGFADRGYGPTGRLLPRGAEGAILRTEDAVAQALSLAADGVRSLCVHSDSPGAPELLRAVRAALEAARHVVAPFA
jgi:UPF0271 protein